MVEDNLKTHLTTWGMRGDGTYIHLKRLSFVLLLLAVLLLLSEAPTAINHVQITDVALNLSDYPEGKVPRYGKLEISFSINNTVATNLLFPYDPTPPPGLQPEAGITVEGHFSADNWATSYVQPGFFFVEHEAALVGDRQWLYPTHKAYWKVRFSPHKIGQWHFKIVAQDASGMTSSPVLSFEVYPSETHGFLKVADKDSRYFEFDDGTYFPALGYNLNASLVNWVDPESNSETFQVMQQNGIQLVRTWLSQWSIFGSAWGQWYSHNPVHNTQEPQMGLTHENASELAQYPTLVAPPAIDDVYMWLNHDETVFLDGKQYRFNPCRVLGWRSAPVALKQDTNYRIRVRYYIQGLSGPRVPGQPFGLSIKEGGWLWGSEESDRCYFPGTGTVRAATYNSGNDPWQDYPDPENPGWRILEGWFNSEGRAFLDRLYLAIENVTEGHAFIDHVWLEEVLEGNIFGPNLVYKPAMGMHTYINQRNAFAFDKVLELAEHNDIFFKLVLLEKNDYIFSVLRPDGSLAPSKEGDLFYGNAREIDSGTKTRWLHKAWWRYAQARWGYSRHIHSWELLNEGPPGPPDGLHWILADEFGKYMKCEVFGVDPGTDCSFDHPNSHLVTTSFWGQNYPVLFWSNTYGDYPDLDYADIHRRAWESSDPAFYDAALFSLELSMELGANQANGPSKPVMRGEIDWRFDLTQDLFSQNASEGLWLHNLIWAAVNSGGLIEHFWLGNSLNQIHQPGLFDHRHMFRSYYLFIKDLPLSNGNYQDASAEVSSGFLRVLGQKDLENDRVHLWIQNTGSTWENKVNGVTPTPISATVSVSELDPNLTYSAAWWDTFSGTTSHYQSVQADSSGTLVLTVNDLRTDIAVRIAPQLPSSTQPQPVRPSRHRPLPRRPLL